MDFPRLYPPRLFSDENFGTWLAPRDYLNPFYDMAANYYCPWKWFKQTRESGSTVENEKGNYKITLDVQHYRPNEISVKVTDNEIIVEGNHEERADAHGFVMRHFKRRYALPNHCPSDNVTSALSSDGVLTIIAEKRSCKDNEKIVPIKMCGEYSKKVVTETSKKEVVNNANDAIKKLNETMLQEEHSRLLKPELLKETITERNKEKIESKTVDTSNKCSEAMGASVLEESLRKSKEMSDIAGKKEYKDLASSSEMSGLKHVSQRIIEESSSSYKSSMSMSASSKSTGKASK